MLPIISLTVLLISYACANPTSDACIEPNPPVRYFSFNLRQDQPCSGRGTCVNGKCTSCETWQGNRDGEHVNVVYSGQYCECDNISCPRFNRVMCAGHGRCECGRCVCESGYSSYDCSLNDAVAEDVVNMLRNFNKDKTSS
ncbi:integrin beta-8-like [Paramacrobiotus metropolitanus]|uniref:integrin beta-8-like n=1 Tax=Paramacrobiotus metropolitanus TaxID=2943436 RepID=UPI0024456584|nr:integrin beta-8-like [Paramacrobiotus metropolitanus]